MTDRVALLGHPLTFTLSPVMQEAAFRACGLPWRYIPIPVEPDRLETVLAELVRTGFQGANVTLPYKERLAGLARELTPEARAIGAVNTLVFSPEGILGENTDWLGLLRALEERGLHRPSGPALVLGAGGAGRAVVYALARRGWPVTLLNRDPGRAQRLAREITELVPDAELVPGRLDRSHLARALGNCALLVNATPLGMPPHREASPVPEELPLPGEAVVVDLVYARGETALIRWARSQSARVVPGQEVLLHQGALAFALWTRRTAPLEVMRRALVRAVEE